MSITKMISVGILLLIACWAGFEEWLTGSLAREVPDGVDWEECYGGV